MKSTEVYKEINNIIYPTLKSGGFRKTKSGMLGYSKLLKEHYILIWFQCSQDGFDEFAGSKFIVEVQISKSNRIGDVSVVRRRIPFFMMETELERVSEIENEIVGKLRRPSKLHFIFSMAEDVQRWYLAKFEKTTKRYTNRSDIWFVYFDSADIKRWMEMLEPVVLRLISDFEKTEY